MIKTIALNLGAIVVAFSLVDAPTAKAQFPTIVQITTPERTIPPPPEVRGREHRAKNNPYFGLRSSYSSVRQYYSNPVKTIPQTTRTVILPYGGGYPYYGGYPVYPYRVPRYPYVYPWGVRR